MRKSDVYELARRAERFEPDDPQLRTQEHRRYRPFLYLLMKEWRPDIFVELGTDRGITTRWVSLASPFTRVITVDIAEHPRGCASADKLVNYPNVTRIIGDSVNPRTLEATQKVMRPFKSIDVLFMDSCHKYVHVSAEYELWSRVMNLQRSLVAVDDVSDFSNPGVWRWWQERSEEKMELDFLHLTLGGFGVIFLGDWE